MGPTTAIYRHSLALLTDLYQLTMSFGYWKLRRTDEIAAFHLYFRRPPFASGFTIAAGLDYAIDFLKNIRFEESDRAYLATLTGNDGAPLFEPAFLDYLGNLQFTCDIDAVPEGTVIFPQEPLLRVTGPILQCQLLETILLNMLNFQTLIATKAARIVSAARGEPIMEFGLRRAQGIDGGLAASRAAYIGGCAATSNVLAGKLFGIPVKGTHAHSWVMSFDDELESFEAYAQAMPNNCVFLVDTYDTLEGVRKAAQVGIKLRESGHKMAGIRLDSGDLAYLSIEARKILDDAGLTDAQIVASNDLDENIIENLKQQGAQINIWGVGTKLATAYDQPALGGVYKLGAIRKSATDPWEYRVKVSEQAIKTTTPGILQVRRYHNANTFLGDMIFDTALLGAPGEDGNATIIDPKDPTRRKRFGPTAPHEDLLVPIFRNGHCVYDSPTLPAIRDRTAAQLKMLHPTHRRFLNPHEYPVGLEQRLHEAKTELVLQHRGVPA